MNAADAANVNTLLVWLLEFHDEGPSCEQARDATMALAAGALGALGTGIAADEVHDNWHWADDGYDDDTRYVPIETITPAGERL